MGSKTKKSKAFGKFGVGYGVHVKGTYNKIELQQRKRQVSPFYSKGKLSAVQPSLSEKLKLAHAHEVQNK